MAELGSEIDVTLAGDEPISRERVLLWIKNTADFDLSRLSKLYRLTGDAYCRIQPELGMEATCGLIQRYLLGCIRQNITDHVEIESRFEACMSLYLWLRHLIEIACTPAIVTGTAEAVTKFFLESEEDIRYTIETGFLEHALESAALRPYFEHWASDPRLQLAWHRALEWGKAHPDFTWNLKQKPITPEEGE